MATSTALAAAKDIVVAWLSQTELKGTDEVVASSIAHVLETVANKVDAVLWNATHRGKQVEFGETQVLTNFAAKMEREKVRKRTHDALRRKALGGVEWRGLDLLASACRDAQSARSAPFTESSPVPGIEA
jgi:hypothetical protein